MFSVLVVCEHSQHVTFEFRLRGFEAYSCDILDCTGGFPEWHLKCDGHNAILSRKWDIIIIHAPCTYTCLSGNRWYVGTPERLSGISLTRSLYHTALRVCSRVVLEQPRTIMQSYIGKKSQVIHPYEFGHGEKKETWLWVNGLPLLAPTNIVSGRLNRIWHMGPNVDRRHERSITYSGIAEAMAVQWGDFLKKEVING